MQQTIIVPGDKVFITPAGYEFFRVNGEAKTIQSAQILLSRLTVEQIDIPKQRIKLNGLKMWCRSEHIHKQLEPQPNEGVQITVVPDMTFNGGSVMDIAARTAVKVTQPIVVGRMPMGTKQGNSTVMIVVEHPKTGETIIAETTLKLFLKAAAELQQFDNPKGN